jgi:ribosomal protein S18 acetylase RimI-like enzyme
LGNLELISGLMLFESSNNTNNWDRSINRIIVRPAKLEDSRDLAVILAHSFYDFSEFWDWVYPLLQFTIYEDLRYRFRSRSPLYCCLVASSIDSQGAEQLVGTAEIAIRSPNFWSNNICYPYIANLAVKNNHRRLGVGTKLLSECERIALDWGYRETRLHVLASNNAAKQLYLGNGYQVCQVEPYWGGLLIQGSCRLLLSKQHN